MELNADAASEGFDRAWFAEILCRFLLHILRAVDKYCLTFVKRMLAIEFAVTVTASSLTVYELNVPAGYGHWVGDWLKGFILLSGCPQI